MWGDDRVSQGTIRGWWAPTRGVGLGRVLEAERGKDPKSGKWEGSGCARVECRTLSGDEEEGSDMKNGPHIRDLVKGVWINRSTVSYLREETYKYRRRRPKWL